MKEITPYKDTYDKSADNFKYSKSLAFGAVILALFFNDDTFHGFRGYLWALSVWLECVAIIPQFSMLRNIQDNGVIPLSYVLTLGGNKISYILRWTFRNSSPEMTFSNVYTAGAFICLFFYLGYLCYFLKVQSIQKNDETDEKEFKQVSIYEAYQSGETNVSSQIQFFASEI